MKKKFAHFEWLMYALTAILFLLRITGIYTIQWIYIFLPVIIIASIGIFIILYFYFLFKRKLR